MYTYIIIYIPITMYIYKNAATARIFKTLNTFLWKLSLAQMYWNR